MHTLWIDILNTIITWIFHDCWNNAMGLVLKKYLKYHWDEIWPKLFPLVNILNKFFQKYKNHIYLTSFVEVSIFSQVILISPNSPFFLRILSKIMLSFPYQNYRLLTSILLTKSPSDKLKTWGCELLSSKNKLQSWVTLKLFTLPVTNSKIFLEIFLELLTRLSKIWNFTSG